VAADLAGTGAEGSGGAAPGTRLACGTRLGRPACVVPPVVGELAAAAASQPSSAADDRHPTSLAGAAAGAAQLPDVPVMPLAAAL
jgi:hypothetical protein